MDEVWLSEEALRTQDNRTPFWGDYGFPQDEPCSRFELGWLAFDGTRVCGVCGWSEGSHQTQEGTA